MPVGRAGRRVPTLLYVPDIEPGLALKTLAHLADRIAVTAEESRAYFAPNPFSLPANRVESDARDAMMFCYCF